tara:strand:- start:8946 stop:9881 length:936 start_codon:yes stop_codon:yes gene_type:complete
LIIVTGASGFIGKAVALYLIEKKIHSIILVDFFMSSDKKLKDCFFVHVDMLFDFIDINKKKIDYIIHLGAITDTTETDFEYLNKYNFQYSKHIWSKCVKYSIPLIYASSAATYGDGKFGFSDDHKEVSFLKPLNLYAESKHNFDKYVLSQKKVPPSWFGLKFFNVFGFDESKKEKMASIIFQSFHKISKTNKMKLFKSNDKSLSDGDQCRDFIYIKDLVDVIFFLYKMKIESGIFNVGSGEATSFNNLISFVFKFMNKKESIEYIKIPKNISQKYQNYTKAEIKKLRKVGYTKKFTSIDYAIKDYIENYLI